MHTNTVVFVILKGALLGAVAPPYYREYTDWAEVHHPTYDTEAELEASYSNFVESLELVRNHTHPLYEVELNGFADQATLPPPNRGLIWDDEGPPDHRLYVAPLGALPASFDWTAKGAVLPSRNQLSCGSCFSFSATGALSGQYYLKTGELIRFSESQLVDCSQEFGNDGCKGGLQVNCFEYYKKFGAEPAKDYPYTPEDGRCRYDEHDVTAKVKGYKTVAPGVESVKAALVHLGPLSVAMDASRRSFQLYRRGVYSDPECSDTALDHAVLLVGYGTSEEGGVDYWLVQNSWGGSWGSSIESGGGGGFFKIAVAHDCGISETPVSVPVL